MNERISHVTTSKTEYYVIRFDDKEFLANVVETQRHHKDYPEITKVNVTQTPSSDDLQRVHKMIREREIAEPITEDKRQCDKCSMEMEYDEQGNCQVCGYHILTVQEPIVPSPKCEQCGKDCTVTKSDGKIVSITCPIHQGSHDSGDFSYLCVSNYCMCKQ